MTINQTYDYLLQIRRLEAKIRETTLQCEALRSCLLPSGIRYDLDRVQTSPDDQMSAIEAKVIDMEQDIRNLQANKAQAIVDISKAINKLEDDSERIVLLGYYIDKKTIRDVSQMINYTVRGTYHVKRRAVSHLAKLL